MDFNFTEEQRLIINMARQFSEAELAPSSLDWDARGGLERAVFKKAAELGFGGIYVSVDYGGTDLSRLSSALVFEQLARGDVTHTAMLTIHNMATWMIDKFGDTRLRETYVPGLCSGELMASYCLTEAGAGSDAAALETKARLNGDHYILNGHKSFISGAGWSDIYVVMARTSDDGARGISAFVVEADSPGLSFGANENKMGWRAQPTAQVIFEDCIIPAHNLIGDEGAGFGFAMMGLDGGRINIGACSLGGAQAGFEAALKYSQERVQFGRPIAQFQNSQFTLADMATELEAARLMIYKAAHSLDTVQPDAGALCAMAKRFSTDIGFKVANQALQLHGGYGYLQDYGVEKIVRDLRVHQILEGTNEIMRMIIARHLLS